MANNEKQNLLGRPYVLWNSRPAKNGQPPPCYGQCNINVGTRKVGAAMRRLPQLQYGMKAKEEILQKWDPISRSLVNIHYRAPPPTLNSATLSVKPPLYNSALNSYQSQFSVSFKTTLENVEVSLKIYKVGSPDVLIYDQSINSNSQGGITLAAEGILGQSYYAVIRYADLVSTSPRIALDNLTFLFDADGPGLFEANDYYPGYNNQLFRIQYIANIETDVKYELFDRFGIRVPVIDYKNGGSLVDYVIENTSEGFINLVFDATAGRTYYAVITPNGGSLITTANSSPYVALVSNVSLVLESTLVFFPPPATFVRKLLGTWNVNVPCSVAVSLSRSTFANHLIIFPVAGPFNVPDTATSYSFGPGGDDTSTVVEVGWSYFMTVEPIATGAIGIPVSSGPALVLV